MSHDELTNARIMANNLMQPISPQMVNTAFAMVAQAIRDLCAEIERLKAELSSVPQKEK